MGAASFERLGDDPYRLSELRGVMLRSLGEKITKYCTSHSTMIQLTLESHKRQGDANRSLRRQGDEDGSQEGTLQSCTPIANL